MEDKEEVNSVLLVVLAMGVRWGREKRDGWSNGSHQAGPCAKGTAHSSYLIHAATLGGRPSC